MDRVVIGMDPHKASVTLEARDARKALRARGRFRTDGRGYRQLLRFARLWPLRTWAVQGAHGIGRATRGAAAGPGGAGRGRAGQAGRQGAGVRHRAVDEQGGKTDATDAHAVAMAALRDKGCAS